MAGSPTANTDIIEHSAANQGNLDRTVVAGNLNATTDIIEYSVDNQGNLQAEQ